MLEQFGEVKHKKVLKSDKLGYGLISEIVVCVRHILLLRVKQNHSGAFLRACNSLSSARSD
jgi:hypothetical protein